MSNRGDVLRLRRRLGFGDDAEGEPVVVVQAGRLNAILPTVLVVPLDAATSIHAKNPLAVPVSAAEVGAKTAHVAVTTHVRVVPGDRLTAGAVGRLRRTTMDEVDRALRLVLDLP